MTYRGKHRMTQDPLAPARGIVYGIVWGLVLWAVIVFVVWRWLT